MTEAGPNRIGIDLGGTKTEAVVMRPDGSLAARERIATPPAYAESLEAITALVARLEADSGPCRIGLGHPGSLNPATGLMRNANSTWLNGQPLQRDLETRLDRPVRTANDADCFALSEARDGAGAGYKTVFGVILGTGVGGGLVMAGQLHAGAGNKAGEWGHNPLPWPVAEEYPGPDCWCEKQGCLEAWLSGPGLAEDHRIRTGETRDAAELLAADDAAARQTQDRHASRLARGLAHVINLIDPDVIVLGGGVSNAPGLAERVEAALPTLVFADGIRTPVRRHAHGDSSGVRGAAWLWPDQAE
ncbi:ROK family protein [Maricaulis alexandrii]|uniref:ROK family protein n=1 Tax=Maricaulis alexandrii TaxID=2570354 RepID=UPI00110800E7|nr:ROK family protein [Maricaulis alexandrii]